MPLATGERDSNTLPLFVWEEFDMAATLQDLHLMTPVTRVRDEKQQ
jgi:hypothetical protein